jgi:predicted house-cleaning noncanonical NTP pyrophosphatase (MazG superfamily)
MCMMESRRCVCGSETAHLNFRDNLLFPEILLNLYCPLCSPQTNFDPETMVADCGWIMEYDMEGAQAIFIKRNQNRDLTPEIIFDEGFLTWQGFSPADHEIRAELHQKLAPLIQEDMKQFLESLKTEWLAHVERLKAAGWRRAQQA